MDYLHHLHHQSFPPNPISFSLLLHPPSPLNQPHPPNPPKTKTHLLPFPDLHSSNSSANSVPGVNSGAPSGTWCNICTTSPPALRHLLNTSPITFRDFETSWMARRPWSYSFWASTMMRVESLGVGLESGRLRRERKEEPDCWGGGIVEVCCCGLYLEVNVKFLSDDDAGLR